MAGRRINGRTILCGALAWAGACGAAAADLRFEPEAVDFGRRAQNQNCTAEVSVSNVTDHPVTILKVESDCGCTSGQVKETQLLPGKQTSLTVRLETRGGEGELRHVVWLATKDSRQMVSVRADVYRYAHWKINPARLVFPPSRQGAAAEAGLWVEAMDGERLAPGAATAGASWMEIEALPSDPAHPTLAGYRIRKRADAPSGSLFGSVRIATRDAEARTLEVPAFAYVTSAITVSPNPVILGRRDANKTDSAIVRLSGWSASKPPRAELTGADIRVKDGGDGVFVLSITPTAGGAGGGVGSLLIYDGERLVLEVPVVR